MAATTDKRDDEKVQRVFSHDDDGDAKPQLEEEEGIDYTGAAKKTDPEEIALVRKLDYRIMVCPSPHSIESPADVKSPRCVSCTSSTTSTEMPSHRPV